MLALLVAFGSYGDVLPMIAIGAELRRRGHDVTLASAEPFAGMAERAGLDFEALTTTHQYSGIASSPAVWRPVAGIRTLFSLATIGVRPTIEFVRRRRRKRETIVIGNSLAFGARMAHDALGVPMVTVHMTAAVLQSRLDPPRLAHLPRLGWLPTELGWRLQMGVDEHFIDPAATPRLNAVRAEHRLAPIKRLRHWWNAPFRTLLMCPDWFVAPQPDWPPQLRQCAFPQADHLGAPREGLDPETKAFLAKDGPVAAVTYGSVMPGGAAFYRAAVEACRRQGLRALVMTSSPLELPPELARITRVTSFAPLGEVARRCVVGLHHGGIGTISRFFAAGVPQLITPLAFDQFDNAERTRRLGGAAVLGRRRFTAGGAAARLEALRSSPDVAAATRRIAELSQGDGTPQACDLIEAEFERARSARDARSPDGSVPTGRRRAPSAA